MSQQWYCEIGGQELGPVSSGQLKAMAARGQLSREDRIRKADSDRWAMAGKVQGLFSSATPPSLPPRAATAVAEPPAVAAVAASPDPVAESQPTTKKRAPSRIRTAYAKANLTSGEEILHAAAIHPLIFLPTAIYASCVVAGVVLFSMEHIGWGMALFLVGLLLTPLRGLVALVAFLTTECVLTNRRLIAKTGFIRRVSVELLLSKVESVNVQQSILGRLLNYGTIAVSGTGGSSAAFPGIWSPMKFRKRVQEEIAVRHG